MVINVEEGLHMKKISIVYYVGKDTKARTDILSFELFKAICESDNGDILIACAREVNV